MTTPRDANQPSICVVIPCYNERATVADVVRNFRKALPDAQIIVIDNNSTDGTADLARQADPSVIIWHEKRQGKGFAVRKMFQEVNADIAIMVDGDNTYPAAQVQRLLQPIHAGKADMVVGNRLLHFTGRSFRPLHLLGNRGIVTTINLIFGSRIQDMLSGYRAMTRELLRSVPITSKGFEIETELTLQSLYRDFVIAEVPIDYGERPPGSTSKLNTFRDGLRVLVMIIDIFKAYRPLLFFSLLGGASLLAGFLILLFWSMNPAATTGDLRPWLGSVVMISGSVLIGAGLVLDIVKHHVKELSLLVNQRGKK